MVEMATERTGDCGPMCSCIDRVGFCVSTNQYTLYGYGGALIRTFRAKSFKRQLKNGQTDTDHALHQSLRTERTSLVTIERRFGYLSLCGGSASKETRTICLSLRAKILFCANAG